MQQQADGVSYEVIVVDNNSREDTRTVVDAALARGTPVPLRYVREPRPGVSHARNTGVSLARSSLIAFLDDDGIPVPTWVREMKRALDEHPDVDYLGARVRPRWSAPPPTWITAADAGPIGIRDRAEAALVDRDHASACLGAANNACRREAFEEVGGFSPLYRRGQDREFERRLWRAGKRGMFADSVRVIAPVDPARLTKSYHRRWYETTGVNHARVKYREVIDRDGRLVPPMQGRSFLGVPLFLYRDCLVSLAAWAWHTVRCHMSEAFYQECQLRYFAAYIQTRARLLRRANP